MMTITLRRDETAKCWTAEYDTGPLAYQGPLPLPLTTRASPCQASDLVKRKAPYGTSVIFA